MRALYRHKHYIDYDDKSNAISARWPQGDPYQPEGLTLPKKRPQYLVLSKDFGPPYGRS